jgi:hypothetical protein
MKVPERGADGAKGLHRPFNICMIFIKERSRTVVSSGAAVGRPAAVSCGRP